MRLATSRSLMLSCASCADAFSQPVASPHSWSVAPNHAALIGARQHKPGAAPDTIFSQKHFRCLGSRSAYFAARGARPKRWETVRNSSGRTPLGRSETEATTCERTGNRGSGDSVNGKEPVGNSLGREHGRAFLRGSCIVRMQSCWHRCSRQIPSMRLPRKIAFPRLFKGGTRTNSFPGPKL